MIVLITIPGLCAIKVYCRRCRLSVCRVGRVRIHVSVCASEHACVSVIALTCMRFCMRASVCTRARAYVCACVYMCVCACEYQFFLLGARRCLCECNAVQGLCFCLYACVRVCGCGRGICYASTMFDAHIASTFVKVHLLTWQSSRVRWTSVRIMPHAAI